MFSPSLKFSYIYIMKPQIIGVTGDTVDIGGHNEHLEESIERVKKSGMYKDLSTVIICPTRGTFPTRVVQSWMKLQRPLNHNVYGPIFAESMQVDKAYNALVNYVVNSKLLGRCKYILTMEEDNLPPVDGLLRLYESMDEYDVVGGLYWGKYEDGFPMIFGNPENGYLDSAAQTPKTGEVQRCNALGMGFTLFKTEIFRDIEEPWFETVEGVDERGVERKMTQDFYFFRKAAQKGYKFAVDNRILVGHYDSKNDKVW